MFLMRMCIASHACMHAYMLGLATYIAGYRPLQQLCHVHGMLPQLGHACLPCCIFFAACSLPQYPSSLRRDSSLHQKDCGYLGSTLAVHCTMYHQGTCVRPQSCTATCLNGILYSWGPVAVVPPPCTSSKVTMLIVTHMF